MTPDEVRAIVREEIQAWEQRLAETVAPTLIDLTSGVINALSGSVFTGGILEGLSSIPTAALQGLIDGLSDDGK